MPYKRNQNVTSKLPVRTRTEQWSRSQEPVYLFITSKTCQQPGPLRTYLSACFCIWENWRIIGTVIVSASVLWVLKSAHKLSSEIAIFFLPSVGQSFTASDIGWITWLATNYVVKAIYAKSLKEDIRRKLSTFDCYLFRNGNCTLPLCCRYLPPHPINNHVTQS